MTIGIPRAFLYYRYHHLWEAFFRALDCDVVVSPKTNRAIVEEGSRLALDETCLPLKLFLGHVASLAGRCDAVFVPRLMSRGRESEYCVRAFGLFDTAQSMFPSLTILGASLDRAGEKAEEQLFLTVGKALGKRKTRSRDAYRAGRWAQDTHDVGAMTAQLRRMDEAGKKILLAGQPYLLHDGYVSGAILRTVEGLGGKILYSDRFDRTVCQKAAQALTPDCYWLLNKEISGAVERYRSQMDGVILLAAFPCGNDALMSEMIVRRTGDVPMIRLLLDEQQGEAGLQTRLESFMDMLAGRRVVNG